MASKTLLVVLSLALVALVIEASLEVGVEEDLNEVEDLMDDGLGEALTLGDFREYFNPAPVEKRRKKIGSKSNIRIIFNNKTTRRNPHQTLY